MFDRAMATVIATAAAGAAAVMAVFALGFSLYALIVPQVGPAGASAIVALVAALAIALYALFVAIRRRQKEREAALLQAQVMEEMPLLGLGDIARDHPLLTVGVSAVVGLIAARNPAMVRDLLAVAARFMR